MARVKQKNSNRRGVKTRAGVVLLAAVLLLSLLGGAVILLSPRAALDAAQAEQDALMENILLAAEAGTDGEAEESAAPHFVRHYEISGPETEAPQAETETGSAASGVTDGSGILTIEKIDLKMPVTPGVSEEQLNIAAGWVTQTAAIGDIGNAVIAGHRRYDYGRQFNRLGELAPGDTIEYLPVGGEAMTYTVFEILVVEPDDQSAFEQPDDRAVLTLYTCTPIRAATHRLLVRAERTT